MKSVDGASRPYVSAVRDEQARRTRRRILDSAYELFVGSGYAGTSMAAVATAAGVSTQTVYNAVGSKAALLKEVYDVRLVGDDEPVPLAQRPEVRAMYADPDPRSFLLAYARLGGTLLERLGPLLSVVVAGAHTGDAELQELLRTVDGERLVGTGFVVRHLAEGGHLREGVDVDRARDTVWTLNSVEVWELLVVRRGWSRLDYETRVGEAMADALLSR